MNKTYLTLAEAAQYLNVSTHTLYKWVEARKNVDYTRCGRKILFPVKSLDEYLERNTVTAISKDY